MAGLLRFTLLAGWWTTSTTVCLQNYTTAWSVSDGTLFNTLPVVAHLVPVHDIQDLVPDRLSVASAAHCGEQVARPLLCRA